MTRDELKSEIMAHLLGFLSKKSLLECNDKLCEAYLGGALCELSEVMDELEEELMAQYNIKE